MGILFSFGVMVHAPSRGAMNKTLDELILPTFESSPGDQIRLGDRQSSGETSARDLEQGVRHSPAPLFCPVDVSTGLQPGRLPILRRTGAVPSIVTSVTLLGDRRITILSSGG
jgi:hypothetical protein